MVTFHIVDRLESAIYIAISMEGYNIAFVEDKIVDGIECGVSVPIA